MQAVAQRPNNVVWQPNPGGQMAALSCPASDILIHGNRGGGKTETMLAMYLQHVGKGFGSAWTGAFFRNEFKELGDVVRKTASLIPRMFPKAKWKAAATEYKWVFPGGEELLLRHAKSSKDYGQYHGSAIPFQAYDELTKWPSLDFKEDMKSCQRSPNPLVPKVQVSGTNPSGVLHNVVKKEYIDKAPPGVLFGSGSLKKAHIRISFLQNPALFDNDKEYIERLQNIRDPYLRAAWLSGSWNIVSGGALDDLFDESLHVYDPKEIEIPKSWPIRRGLDWGQSKPFSVGWHAVCPNDQIIKWKGGTTKKIVKGTMFRVAEFYGAKPNEKNKGLNWSNKQMAGKIIEIEDAKGWRKRVKPGAADAAIFTDSSRGKEKSQYDYFKAEGAKFVPSVKGQGSRVAGLSLFRERLDAAFPTIMEHPAYFISSDCREAISQLPMMKRDEKNSEDVDTDQEDHLYDEIRYQFQNYESYGGMMTA